MKVLCGIIVLFEICHFSSINSQISLSLTVYNDGFAMVKEVRSFSFDKGQSTLFFTDVPDLIDPSTVSFKAISSPTKIRVFQQDFLQNTVQEQKLIKKYIGKQIELYADFANASRRIRGTLIANNQKAAILRSSTGIGIYSDIKVMQLPGIPQDLQLTPTLRWIVYSQMKTTTDCEVSYRTQGFYWNVDYTFTLAPSQDKIDIGAWITIRNINDKKFDAAKLKLVSGDINSQPNYTAFIQNRIEVGSATSTTSATSSPSFSSKSFSDYHLYTLNRPTTINANSIKQVQFFQKIFGVEVSKFYVVRIQSGGRNQENLQVKNIIRFNNTKQQGLGIALPKGNVKVLKQDPSDGSLQLIGQDKIHHTPVNQKITIQTGSAFDIIAKQIAETRTSSKNGYDANMRLNIINLKKTQVRIEVRVDHQCCNNFQIKLMNQQIQLEKISSHKYRFYLKIEPNSETDVRWTEKSTEKDFDY